MIKHIVFWQLKDEADGRTKLENAKIMKERLENLNGKIDGLLSLQVGFNENGGEYDAALVSEHTDDAALKAYAVHPLHVEIQGFVKNVAASRAAVDFEF
ncbi:MAG: Dabb family protein [Eubacteriales bacterium]|nr:Dabb family protein [Eubacteriales bacterium]